MKIYDLCALPVTLDIGMTGSNRQREFGFDIRAWAREYPGAVFAVCCRRTGEGADNAYFGDTRTENGILIWTVHRADLGVSAGNGKIEIWAIHPTGTVNDEPLYKSRAVITIVGQSIAETPSQTLPEAARPWAQQVLDAAIEAGQAADRAEGAVEHYPQVGENGNWWVWDVAQGRFVDTGVPASGGGGGGAVYSVNGKTGTVVLNAEDVGALPDTTEIPDVPEWALQDDKPAYTATEITDGQTNVAAEISALSQQKADLNQGAANVGKFWTVGPDGGLLLQTLAVWQGGNY